MSTEDSPRRARAQARAARGRARFRLGLLGVLGALLLAIVGLGAVSLNQGPRISNVQVDPAEAVENSGSRIILTVNEALTEIDPAQVSVEPAVPFTVDAAGRSIGVRFTVPLDDETEYTVRVSDALGVGGGPAADLETSFQTPASEIFLMRRTVDGEDQIFRSDLAGEAVPVFSADRVNDFRATATRLVVAVEEGETSKVLVMDLDGQNQRELALPGDGDVSAVQVSERGGLVGYTYTDHDISETAGRASVLVTQPISGEGEPQIIEVGGEEASVAEWQFVPDSAAVLFIDFNGSLLLDDLAGSAGPQNMGSVFRINGISRGTYTAIVEHADGSVVELDLSSGQETPLEASEPDFGQATTITPFPGGTLRHIVHRDDLGLPIGQSVVRVDDDGTATSLIDVEEGSAILQSCPSPSGQYAAVTVAPDLVNNNYDTLQLALPQTLRTHLIDLRTGEETVVLDGFNVSWCQRAPGTF